MKILISLHTFFEKYACAVYDFKTSQSNALEAVMKCLEAVLERLGAVLSGLRTPWRHLADGSELAKTLRSPQTSFKNHAYTVHAFKTSLPSRAFEAMQKRLEVGLERLGDVLSRLRTPWRLFGHGHHGENMNFAAHTL